VTYALTLLSRVAYHDREVAGPRLRGLLALLAGDLATGCGTRRLIEGLWPDEQPENPGKALQILVSRARSQLDTELIVNTATGYRLDLDEDEIDATAVVARAAASARSARAGDHEEALAAAESALAAWDGPPDAEPEAGDPLAELRAERAETYWSLVRGRALALSRLGRSGEAIEPLAELARHRPRDEELLLELLRSEAAELGPSAALARYETYRRSLRDELGADPGDALQAAYQQLLHAGLPAVRQGVSHEPNQLLGRGDDVAGVADLLRTSRVVSIVGVGGLGKTRVAHAVSRQAEQRVVHVVGLAGLTSESEVVGEVATALGVGEARRASVGSFSGRSDAVAGIVGALGPAPALLVLDNCEHVLGGVVDLVHALVPTTSDLRILTTSRAPLGLTSEAVYRLPELAEPAAVALFEQRARAARPGIDLPVDLVAQLCRRLDGLPLGIELAAARTRVLSVAEIADRLEDRFALLRGAPRDVPERHQTLQAVVDWSWALLEPRAQAAMRALATFPDGFTADAARRVLDEADRADPLRILEDLVDQSLLQVVEVGSGTRFRMLETVREFSAARRDDAGETALVTDRFLAWARDVGVAEHDGIFRADAFPSAERIRVEQDNLMRAVRVALVREDGATVAALTAALAGLWAVDANYTRMLTLVGETGWLLSHYHPEPEQVEVLRSAVTQSATNIFLLQGPRATRALATLRRLPPATPSTVIGALSILLCSTSTDPTAASLRELCERPEPLLAGVANCAASYIWESEGEPDAALDAARRMLDAVDGQSNPWIRVGAHLRIAELCLHFEQGTEALEHGTAALRILDAAGPWTDVLQIRWSMVLACLQVGAIDEAEHWLELAARDGAPDAYGVLAFELGARAEIQLARGNVEQGLLLWRRAVDRIDEPPPAPELAPADHDPWSPWALGLRAVAVTAHARHGRSDLVEGLTADLARALPELLANPGVRPASFVVPTCGAMLLALAMVDLDRGRDGVSAVRMIALAERFRLLREFQPTMSVARARQAAERADGPAYAAAVATYAGLSLPESLAAARAVLRERNAAIPS
jgi:predicted ATPase/DNA-binding SARP family transcriptional activator